LEAINRRVVKLIDLLANSNKEFSDKTGISTVILSHINSGRNKVSLGAVQAILQSFPQVNPEWLILGKGEIYKDKIDHTPILNISKELEELQQEIAQNMRHNSAKIQHLLSQLRSLTEY
jgi:predicted transcriptional regulator